MVIDAVTGAVVAVPKASSGAAPDAPKAPSSLAVDGHASSAVPVTPSVPAVIDHSKTAIEPAATSIAAAPSASSSVVAKAPSVATAAKAKSKKPAEPVQIAHIWTEYDFTKSKEGRKNIIAFFRSIPDRWKEVYQRDLLSSKGEIVVDGQQETIFGSVL